MTHTEEPARWIGIDVSGLIEHSERMERFAGYAAVFLADAVLADDTQMIIQETRMYRHARARADQAGDLRDRCFGSASVGRWAGYLVRESDGI